jgi:uncharacterized coiled-coil protein SlyX
MLREGWMAALDERVSRLEGQVSEQSLGFPELRDSIGRLDVRLTGSIARVEDRLTRLEDRMSTQFFWLVGMMATILAAVIGGLLSR